VSKLVISSPTVEAREPVRLSETISVLMSAWAS
jgi:hypothetical protein